LPKRHGHKPQVSQDNKTSKASRLSLHLYWDFGQ